MQRLAVLACDTGDGEKIGVVMIFYGVVNTAAEVQRGLLSFAPVASRVDYALFHPSPGAPGFASSFLAFPIFPRLMRSRVRRGWVSRGLSRGVSRGVSMGPHIRRDAWRG